MDSALIDFSCSDAGLSQQWRADVSVYDSDALVSLIAERLDVSQSGADPPSEYEEILTPLRSIVGISAEEPGFTCVRIAPHPDGLSWAHGRIAIFEGLVAVRWDAQPDRFVLDVSIPVGVHLKTVLPAHPTDELFMDGEPVNPDTQTIRTAHHVELAVLPGSDYRFEVVAGTIA